MKRIVMTLLAVFALLAVANTAEAGPRVWYSSGYYAPYTTGYYAPYTTGYYGPAYTSSYVVPGPTVTSSSYYDPNIVVAPSTAYYPSATYYPSTTYYAPATGWYPSTGYYPSGAYYSAPLGTRYWRGR